MKWLLNITLILFFIFCGNAVRANHVIGGDLLYTHISGNTYKLTLTVYGDCSSLRFSSAFDLLPNSRPRVNIYNGSTLINIAILEKRVGSGVDVSPVCPTERANTSCNGGTLPGIYQFIYEDTIVLPTTSANWRFVFQSSLGNSIAGRSISITNVGSVGGTYMQLTATLNNIDGPNSSPQYSTIPTGYYCNNVLQRYNQGATDVNGDSLVFSLVPAIDSATGGSVSYIFPFTATAPMGTAVGNFSFNSLNGQLDFTPNITQGALIVNRVSEYKAGKLVGTSEREMTFIIRDDCNGVPPLPYIGSISGAVVQSGNIIAMCKGNPSIAFNINMANASGDTILITPRDIPAGAVLTIANNNSLNPVVNFTWNTAALTTGIYTFLLDIKNNRCPISSSQTVAYTIRVAELPTITVTQLSQTRCIENAQIRYDIKNGFAPRKVSIFQAGTFVKAYLDTTGNDTAGVVYDNLPAGSYTVVVSSDSLCVASATFAITDSGTLPVSPVSFTFCQGAPAVALEIPLVATGATIQWFSADGTPLSAAPTISTDIAGTYSWYFVETYKTCTSDNIPVKTTIHPLPKIAVTSLPTSICYGDRLYLTAKGAVQYEWFPKEAISIDTGGAFIYLFAPTSVMVVGKDEFGCTDSAEQTYNNIIRCCNLSYPTAFTPNNDGYNDGWKVVTYGNMQRFEVAIFNRFGQRVFSSNDPTERWEGTFLGQPCEIGTYYFMLDAQCLTGPKKTYKGDITLIR